MKQDIIKITREIVTKMGVEVSDIKEEEFTNTLFFDIQTKDGDFFTNRDGLTLRALNHVVGRMIFTKYPEPKNFTIDVNGYYKKHLEVIKQKAKFAGDRAKSFKTNIDLEPMNSFERMIVHSVFAEENDIETHSDGYGAERHVVLSYKGE